MIPANLTASVGLLFNTALTHSFKFSAHKNPIRFSIWLMKNQPLRWAWLLQHENILTSESPKFNFKEVYLQLQKYLATSASETQHQ